MDTLAQALKALCEPTRLEIMALLLWQGELCVCDVEGVLGISQSKASRHLRYLLTAGLVKNRRAGAWMHYSIPEPLPAPQQQFVAALRQLLDPTQHKYLADKLASWRRRMDARTPC